MYTYLKENLAESLSYLKEDIGESISVGRQLSLYPLFSSNAQSTYQWYLKLDTRPIQESLLSQFSFSVELVDG